MKIAFIECEAECGFGVEFKHLNRIFYFCKEHKFGVNIADDDTHTQICGGCHKEMKRYRVDEETNCCPICEQSELAVCYTH